MAEERISERIDANLLGIPLDELESTPKSVFLTKFTKLRSKTEGRLIVKEYPTAGAGANHFRHLLNELKLKKNFVPDIIYIDYLNICSSSRIKMGGSVNTYVYVKSITEELRGLAIEFDLPIMTATQTNRSGQTDSDLDFDGISECIHPHSLVLTKSGYKRVEDISVGEYILGSVGWVKVSIKHCPKTKRSYEITTKSGKKLILSADHIVATGSGRKSINTGLTIGDKLNTL
jgi:hypothetical protein